jgi:hypothetical protein
MTILAGRYREKPSSECALYSETSRANNMVFTGTISHSLAFAKVTAWRLLRLIAIDSVYPRSQFIERANAPKSLFLNSSRESLLRFSA